MTRTGMIAAAGLAVAVNGFVLGRVALNRTGEPDASVTLTERELPVAYSPHETENSAVALRLDFSHPGSWSGSQDPDLDVLKWLDGSKLSELGFDVRLPSRTTEAASFLSRQLSRRAYAVVEFQGPVWKAYSAALERKHGERGDPQSATRSESWDTRMAARELRNGSRLFLVDAALDAAALRARYPDRGAYLILPAKIWAYLDQDRNLPECRPETCRARGSISLLIDEVVVPRRLHSSLPAVAGTGQERSDATEGIDPRYEVTLLSGALHEPWVQGVRPLSGVSP